MGDLTRARYVGYFDALNSPNARYPGKACSKNTVLISGSKKESYNLWKSCKQKEYNKIHDSQPKRGNEFSQKINLQKKVGLVAILWEDRRKKY